MPEASQIEYHLRELAEVLVRDRGVKEGHWMVLVRFKFGAANVGTGPDDLSPSAFAVVDTIGIQRTEPNSISVDASKVNGQARQAPAKRRVTKPAKN